jgi:signal peptidase I
VAAVAVLVATLWLPVLQIYGTSMAPTLNDGELVVSLKSGTFNTGDVIAFYYNNKILVKRVIAGPGDWVDIKDDGTVYVNDVELDEPYVVEKALGDCNITLPYQVPESRVFVMGDHRSVSVDSRNTAVGCVSEEQIVGRLVMRLWPLSQFGEIK